MPRGFPGFRFGNSGLDQDGDQPVEPECGPLRLFVRDDFDATPGGDRNTTAARGRLLNGHCLNQ